MSNLVEFPYISSIQTCGCVDRKKDSTSIYPQICLLCKDNLIGNYKITSDQKQDITDYVRRKVEDRRNYRIK